MAGASPAIALEPLRAGAVPPEVTLLYARAFPARERLPVAEMLRWGRGYQLLHDGRFCGFAFVCHRNGLAWLLYLAIAEEFRNQGLGTAALAALEASYPGHRFIIDVEAALPDAPNLPERLRRNGFWQRNGFQEAHFGFHWRGEQYAFFVKGGTLTHGEIRRFWAG